MRRRAKQIVAGLAALVVVAAAASFAVRKAERTRHQAEEASGGNARLAPALMRRYGCSSCHAVPGVRAPGGLVGPPLGRVAQQVYVGGVLPNSPDNMRRWIVDPKAFSPRSAMPRTGIGESDARHVVAYLYALP